MKKLTVLAVVLALFLTYVIAAYAADQGSKKILREGLLGAATGAVAAGASGGKAGKGALIGAGVNIVGGALLDTITGEQVGTVDQVSAMPSQDAFQQGYQQGYNQGHTQGYQQGYNAGFTKGYEAGESKR